MSLSRYRQKLDRIISPECMRETSTYFLKAAIVIAFTTIVGAVKACRSRFNASAYLFLPTSTQGASEKGSSHQWTASMTFAEYT